MTAEEWAYHLPVRWAGRQVIYLEETDSTNEQAKRLAEEGAVHGTLVIAEQQNNGKGRRGRSWSSPHGTDIFMSLVLKPELKPECASMVTLVAALSVCQAVEAVTGLKPMIKWPNDLVLNKRKVTGILTEMSADPGRIQYIVLGIGINVNRLEFPIELKDMATSLRLEAGRQISREELTEAFLKYFEDDFEQYEKTGDLRTLMGEYNKRLINRGNEVRILEPAGEYSGKALGINEKGGLMVERENYRIEVITSGEVSVRGVYGYV